MRSMQVMWTALVDHLEGRLDDAAVANDELLSLALADPNVLLGWFVQLVAILAAALLFLLPGTAQQNQAWLLFALPAWIALSWTMRRRR